MVIINGQVGGSVKPPLKLYYKFCVEPIMNNLWN